MSAKTNPRRIATLNERTLRVLELRQGSRTERVPSARRRAAKTARGGRQGERVALRNGAWV